MDAALTSLWISVAGFAVACASLVVALASASFSRRQARAAEAQLQRKDPVFEVDLSAPRRQDGWAVGKIIVRNNESVRCDIQSVAVKASGITLISQEDGFTRDADGQIVLQDIIPMDKAGKQIEIDHRLGFNKGPSIGGGAVHILFGYKGPLTSDRLKYSWKWADK